MGLRNKKVLLGVTASIAAYKACDLVQLLKQEGAEVRVIMTPQAADFVSPMVFHALSGSPVHISTSAPDSAAPLAHIDLARWADLYLIAPCTAHTIGELACGLAGSLVSATALSFKGPVYVAPAMNPGMFSSIPVQENLHTLQRRGLRVLPAGIGEAACGDIGPGKLLEPFAIVEYLKSGLALKKSLPGLSGKRVLLVLGHTQEPIDDIRYIANRSSGKTGLAIARALVLCGARVHLVCGHLNVPLSSEFSQNTAGFSSVSSTKDFSSAVLQHLPGSDALIMSAALADFTPQSHKPGKIKNSKLLKTIELSNSVNVISAALHKKSPELKVVAFALENEGQEALGLAKFKEKGIDLLVINTPLSGQAASGFGKDQSGFGKDHIRAAVIPLSEKKSPEKKALKLSKYSKQGLAEEILIQLNSLWHRTAS